MKILICLLICVLSGLIAGQTVTNQPRDGKESRRGQTGRSRDRRPRDRTRSRRPGTPGPGAVRDGRAVILCPYGITRGWCGRFMDTYCPAGFVCAMNPHVDDPYGVCCSNAGSSRFREHMREISSRQETQRGGSTRRPSRRGSRRSSNPGRTRDTGRQREIRTSIDRTRSRGPGSGKRRTRVTDGVSSRRRDMTGSGQRPVTGDPKHETGRRQRSRQTEPITRTRTRTSSRRGVVEGRNATRVRQSTDPTEPISCPKGNPLIGKCGGSRNVSCPNDYICVVNRRDSDSYGVCCRLE